MSELSKIAKIRALHQAYDDEVLGWTVCTEDDNPWPCETAELLAVLDRQQAVVEAAQKRIKGSHAMGCNAYGRSNFTANPPCDCGRDELMLALATYRAKETES